MFQVDDYVVCGRNGVCKITDIGALNMGGASKNREYYSLVPAFSTGSLIYVPVDGNKVSIRKVMDQAEAEEFLANIPNIEAVWIENDKNREVAYKEAMRSDDCYQWMQVIKSIYIRKNKRLSEGKKMSAVDERYLHEASENLYNEMTVALNTSKEEVSKYIMERLMDSIKHENSYN